MSIMGAREEREREVLAALLLQPSSFDELPDGFQKDAFEFPEYRHFFECMQTAFCQGKATSSEDFVRLLPDQLEVINNVSFCGQPLNGKMRAKAAALMSRRPILSASRDVVDGGSVVSRAHTERRNGFEFDLLNGMDIVTMSIPPKEWLIENLINASSLNFLAGEEGCGKSLLAMNLALSVAVGADSWLSYSIAKYGKVLYLNNEMAFDDFARRLQAQCQSLPAPGDIRNLVVPKHVPPIRECWDTLNKACEELHPALVVIDCLYLSHDEDENDSSAMKALMRKALSLRDAFHLAVILVHHTKKGSRYTTMHNDQMRGSSVFGGSADTTIQIRRSATDVGKRIIKPLKGRHLSDSVLKCRLLSLDPETLWFRDEGETRESDHIAVASQTAEDEVDFRQIFGEAKGLSRKEIQERCKPLGYDERTIDRLIKKKLKVVKYGHYSL
jgi:hypothetical protein